MHFLELLFAMAAVVASVEASSPLPASALGEFVRSDGFLHERFTLTASGSFVYVETGCVGGPTKHEGTVKFSANRLSIKGRYGALEGELTTVAWGQRRCLVPPPDLKRFCAYASGRPMDEPLPFFLRAEDQSKATPSTKQRPSDCR